MKRQTGKGQTVVRMCGELKHDGVTGRPLEMGGQTRESLIQGDVDDEIESAVQMAERKTLAQRMEGPGVGAQLVCSRNSEKARVAGAEGAIGAGAVREAGKSRL